MQRLVLLGLFKAEIMFYLPFHMPQLVKSLLFHIPEAWQRYRIRAEPFLVCHHREYPAGKLARPSGFWRSLPLCRYAMEWCKTIEEALKTIACVAIESTVSSAMLRYCHTPGFYADLKFLRTHHKIMPSLIFSNTSFSSVGLIGR